MSATPAHATTFPSDTAGLPRCRPTELVRLADGDTYDLWISPVTNRLGQTDVRMLAYNGSIPGPTLRAPQGAEVTLRVRNDGDHETTVHWHGLRLENRYDGVPEETQAAIPVGGSFTYRVRFPDDGLYWYHPHVREDYGLEMGLYGNILVDPAGADAWPPATRESIVTLDDVLVEDGRIAPFRVDGPTHTAMGRFGNVMLTGGSTDLRLAARTGEVVRLYLTNTANTRIFNVAIPGSRMKLVGGDSGRYEREQAVEAVLLAPSERAVVDVLFERAGSFPLEHRTPDSTYRLGSVEVAHGDVVPSHAEAFASLHENGALGAERARLAAELERPPDRTLVFDAEMPAAAEPGGHAHDHDHHHAHDTGDGLEWEDLMPEINARTDATNMIWKLVDESTGQANADIDWSFRVGDRVKIRLVNTMDSDHPMHHPFHIHGAGRFLVISRDGVTEPNLAWKDTVLIRAGETVDILLEVTSPGLWMAHCHIAEHNQDGMMFSFTVDADSTRS
ncbi:MAG TPA: multicopper oxidase family protein [Acidimicrobiales bacterium]|nr:multicopper oxidase family protein [Acidimicrobiales bacterium]